MKNFRETSPENIGNAQKLIGKDWMLITSGGKDGFNTMTASWGCLGVLWNKPVCICFVRPERYTYSLIEKEKEFSIAFLNSDRRDAYTVCGRESGKDIDKLKKCGLSTFELGGTSVIAEADTVIACKVLYEDELKESAFLDKSLLSNYASAGYHRMYICEIKEAYKKV